MSLPTFAWRDDFGVGDEAMDATHREFVLCVEALIAAPHATIPEALAACGEHLRVHFGEEDASIHRSAFPEGRCHIDEHAKVLTSLAEVEQAVAAGRLDVARAFAHALMRWFPEHAEVMDGALARWLATQRWGAAPIRLVAPLAS